MGKAVFIRYIRCACTILSPPSLKEGPWGGRGGVNESPSSGDFTAIIDNLHIVPDMNERVSGNDSFGQFQMKGGERQLPW